MTSIEIHGNSSGSAEKKCDPKMCYVAVFDINLSIDRVTACKMAAAISQATFVDVRPREDDFVSESGIVMGSKEIEEWIEGEISRFGASRHRIDAKLIC